MLKVGGKLGVLNVPSLGIGTSRGSENEEVDRGYVNTIVGGFKHGINSIDTASNYRSMQSELAVERALEQAINEGIVKRNEVIVCSKGEFFSYDYREKVEPRTQSMYVMRMGKGFPLESNDSFKMFPNVQ